jgi:hypothetical protein
MRGDSRIARSTRKGDAYEREDCSNRGVGRQRRAAQRRRGQEAYAQGGVYSTYLAVTAHVQPDMVNFAILDTQSRLLLFYKVEPGRLVLEPVVGKFLAKDFQHKAP